MLLPAEQVLEQLTEVQLAQLPTYSDPTEHLRDKLKWLAMLIQLKTEQSQDGQEAGRFGGLIFKQGELGQLFEKIHGNEGGPVSPEIRQKSTEVASFRRKIHLKEAATLWSVRKGAGGCRLPLLEIAVSFALSEFQYNVLLLGLAPEIELAFGRMFSLLLNDVTKRRPSTHLALTLFANSDTEQRLARMTFTPGSPLTSFHLIEIEKHTQTIETSLLLREFKVPERVVMWVMGDTSLSPSMRTYAKLVAGERTFDNLIYPASVDNRINALKAVLEREKNAPRTPLVVLSGTPGVGKRSVATRLARHVGIGTLQVDLGQMNAPPSIRERLYNDLVREARLHGVALCLSNFRDEYVGAGMCPPLPYLYSTLRRVRGLGTLTAIGEEFGLGGAGDGFATLVPLEVPDTLGRIKLWKLLGGQSGIQFAEDVDLKGFALKYGFTGGSLLSVLQSAKEEAIMRTGVPEPPVSRKDLDNACKLQLGQGLSGIASRVKGKSDWDDLVLPEEIMDTLREIIGQAQYRNIVYHDWGFDRKMKYGRGLSILFSGPPGVGKTMVAGVIANALDMDLFKVDLSQIVSKYVGETEKNLKRVFEAAQGNQFIILFDEADSLFAKRTEVKSSVDRYANLEVNYLLQKMEEYGGISVLTTNFEKGIDDAFKRRLNFRVEFPFPEPEDRERLWRVMIPEETPLEKDVDFEWLGEKYELAGGNIKNAVLRAAFWAAEKSRSITMDDLEEAAGRESREIGKLVQGAGF